MSESDSLVPERALARTYDGGYHIDGWQSVTEYRRALSYASRNNVKSGATANALELPRGRVRTWLEGGCPDPARAIDIAREHGWLECTFGDPEFQGLNALVANIFSGGSIAESTYAPGFALNHRGEDSHVFDALELAGVKYRVVDDRDGRADEVRPTTDASVLGRVLAVLGAPVGPKADQHLSIPDYLEDAPEGAREQFVYAYLENRAIPHEGKATLTLREDRNRDYLEGLATLIDDVAGGGVRIGERDIVISKSATENLGTVR
ncbi:hypothetical protein [Natronorubrum halophilum]|uniref:hypothetical protein n=1 Tax=Natronorubrum halophilum TaxID=1702106 RepID=UPI000EF68BB7|nr:hypothetical protein [Natronorubrum halophilum]